MSQSVDPTLRPGHVEAPLSPMSEMLGASRQKDLVSKSPFGEKPLTPQSYVSWTKFMSGKNELLSYSIHPTFGGGLLKQLLNWHRR